MAIGIGGIAGSVLVAVLLYPVFQAIVYRWWLSGLRFGDITVTSRLRIGQVYLIYLRYIGLVWLFMMGASIGIGVLASIIFALLTAVHIAGSQIPGRDVIGAGIGVLFYAAFALGISVMHQVLITFGLWRAAAQSAEISDAPILDTVEAKAGLQLRARRRPGRCARVRQCLSHAMSIAADTLAITAAPLRGPATYFNGVTSKRHDVIVETAAEFAAHYQRRPDLPRGRVELCRSARPLGAGRHLAARPARGGGAGAA